MPADPEEFAKVAMGKVDYTPRRFRIRTEDLGKLGFAEECPGCRAANRGRTAVGHTEACRKRIVEKLEKNGDVRDWRGSGRDYSNTGEGGEENEEGQGEPRRRC